MTPTSERIQDSLDVLDSRDASAALWHIGDPRGHRPSRFTELLLEAVAHASAVDRALLWLAFPGLVAAFDLAVNDPLGPEALARATGGGV
jgi:hypothetical protein